MTTGRNRLMQIIAGQIKDFFEDMLGGTHKDSLIISSIPSTITVLWEVLMD